MQMTDSHRAALDDILRWRRDVRHFRTEPLPEPLFAALMARLALAPSVGNARPWRFLRVRDAGLRAQVCQIFEHANSEAAQGYDGAARRDYAALKLAGLREAPEHLAVFTETAPAEGRGLGRASMPQTLEFSTAMAIHTLWLAARAQGLGLGWVSILDPQAMTRLFDVPPGWRFTGYLCLGWPEAEDDTPLLHRSGWQENTDPGWQEARARHGASPSPSAKGP